MKKINLMTMSMFIQMFFKYMLDHDTDDLKETYEEMLDLVSEAGYPAVDVTAMEVDILGLDYVKKEQEKRGLKTSSFIYTEQFAAMDEDGFQTRIEKAKRGAESAVSLGTEILMLVPHAQDGLDKYESEQIRRRMIEHWIPITEYARRFGLRVVVEDTPDLRFHFCKADEVKEVLDAVAGLELVYDSANMILVGEDPVEYLKKFEGRIAYVHLKDYRIAPAGSMMAEYAQDGTAMVTAPTGTGQIDLNRVIEELEKMGYQGEVTVEFQVDDDNEYLKSLIQSRKYITDAFEVYGK